MKPCGSVQVKGMKELQAAIIKVAKRYPENVFDAGVEVCEEIVGDSKDNYVPRDLNALAGSGHIEQDKQKKECRMVFGGPAAPYAGAVHEHPSELSPPSWKKKEESGRPVEFHPSGRGPHYLQKPLMKRAKRFARDLVKKCKRPKV